MILEDMNGNYIDRAAFNAAYQAFVDNGRIRHAQIRGELAEHVVVELIRARTSHGPADLATAAVAGNIAATVSGQTADWVRKVPAADIVDAVMAAAVALAGDGA